MRLLHVSLTARNAGKLSSFYKTVFGFVERRAPKRLSGAAVSRGNGLPDNDIYSTWLNLPSDNEPFLEIMEYAETVDRGLSQLVDNFQGAAPLPRQKHEILYQRR